MNIIQQNYATVLLLNFHKKAELLPDVYPLYFKYECDLDNPRSLHLQLIKNGLLVPSPASEFFASLKVTDLKNLLQSYNLKVSGKKGDLISRILSSLDNTEIQKILQSNSPHYSLSSKGQLFLREYEDYVQFHRYSSLSVKIQEYDKYRSLLHSSNCEEILIYIFKEKENSNKYHLFYHTALYQLYDTIHDSLNALCEFLTVKYFMVNYSYAQKWLADDLKYLPFAEVAQNIYVSQKACHVVTPDDAEYLSQHLGFDLKAIINTIYKEYPLTYTLFSKNDFLCMLSEMQQISSFDFEKWNTYALKQLTTFLKLS